jgi:hypothetical protein
MDFDGYAIGGLSVGEPRDLTLEMIAEVLPLLPKDKPRYVMGVGYPDEIEQYARMGVDMMDCVLPTRAARHGLLFTSEGRLNIKAKRRDTQKISHRPTQTATAQYAAATHVPTFVISCSPASRSPRSSTPSTIWRITSPSCTVFEPSCKPRKLRPRRSNLALTQPEGRPKRHPMFCQCN